MTPEQEHLLALIADATPVDKACKESGVKVDRLYSWIAKDAEFETAYRSARLAASHRLADKIQELGQLAKDEPEKAQAVRVAADIWKWVAAKQNPREFGDRIEQHVVEERKLTPAEINARIAELQAELVNAPQTQSTQSTEGTESITESTSPPSAHTNVTRASPTGVTPLH